MPSWAEVARFEFRQQTRGPVFWIVAAISLLMVTGSVAVDPLRVGVTTGGLRNGAEAAVRTHLVWTLFYLFTTAAFVGEAVLRDELSGLAPIVRATPASRPQVALGRLAGAVSALLLCFLTVPAALLLAPLFPLVDSATVEPATGQALLFAFLVMAVPNLLLGAALAFALAGAARAMPPILIGAVALLILYGLGARSGAVLPALAEPFGFAAFDSAIAGWPSPARDEAVPWSDPGLLLNRSLVLAIAAGAVVLGVRAADRQPASRFSAEPAAVGAPVARLPLRPPNPPRFGRGTMWAQLAVRTRFELGQTLRTPVFLALLALGLANGIATVRGLPADVGDAHLLTRLAEAFALAPIATILFFAGELFWRERETRTDMLIGVAPVSPTILLLPKLLALLLILAGLTLAAMASALAAPGAPTPGRAGAVIGWGGVAFAEWALLALLAFALQAVSPNKLAGWGLFVVYLIASLTLERLGFADPLYRFAHYPGWPLPPQVSGARGAGLYLLYWFAVAASLLLAALWARKYWAHLKVNHRREGRGSRTT